MVQHADIDHTGLTGVGGSGGAELDYAQATADVTIAGTTEGAPTTLVTGASVAYDGSTAVMIEFFAPRVTLSPGAAGQNLTIGLYEDGTHVGRFAVLMATFVSTQSEDRAVRAAVRRTPSAGSHTYSVRAYKSAGSVVFENGNGGTGAGSEFPAFMRITRV